MGLLRKEPIYLTCSLILFLALAEGWVAWHYLHGMQSEGKAARVAVLERELRAKQAEINHLIFLRDSENRWSRDAVAHARAQARNAVIAARGASDELAPEEELIEATSQAMNLPAPQRQASRRADDRAPTLPSAQYPILPGFPVPSEEEDVMDAPQGAAPVPSESADAELTPADIDPKQLVKMANIMTGHPVAELTRMKGFTVIRYHGTLLRGDDPIWHMLDAVSQSHALTEILLVGREAKDEARLKKVSEVLISSGVPSKMIHIKTGDADYRGLEGILIQLSTTERPRAAPLTRRKT